MCSGNHQHPGIVSLATPQLAVRLLTHREELGLSTDQLHEAIDLCRSWCDRYGELAVGIIQLGVQIDVELCKHRPDRAVVNTLADQRRNLIAELEHEFFDAWERHHSILSDEQYDKFFDIYRAQFSKLPHPVFGTTEYEQFERTMDRAGHDGTGHVPSLASTSA